MPLTLKTPSMKPRFTALKMACMLALRVSLPSSVSLSMRNVQAYLPFDGSTLNTCGKSTTAGCGKTTSVLPYCCLPSVMMGTSIRNAHRTARYGLPRPRVGPGPSAEGPAPTDMASGPFGPLYVPMRHGDAFSFARDVMRPGSSPPAGR